MTNQNDGKLKVRDAVEETVVEISRQHADLTVDQLWDLVKRINRPGITESPWWVEENLAERLDGFVPKLIQKLVKEGRVVGHIKKGGFLSPSRINFDINANMRLHFDEQSRLLENTRMIKKTILEIGTKFTRLQVAEIAENCNITDEALIIETVQDMIAKHQVDAQYFTSTKAVAFNQQANLAARGAFIAELEAEFASWGKDPQQGQKKY